MPEVTINAFQSRITPFLNRFMIEHSAVDSICDAYNERWRAYHAVQHPFGMLNKVVRLPIPMEDRWLLGLLVIYHDVWYKIGREPGENERMSAEWAVNDLRFYTGDQKKLFSLMQQGINATIKHTLDDIDPCFVKIVSYLLDLDLWGLGQTAIRFKQDTEAIWQEFSPRYTRAEFDKGRSAWAASFLERTWIYQNETFRPLEGSARANLMALAG